MQNYWSLVKIKASELDQQIKDKLIVIPKYQRGIVWGVNKKDKLIETIKMGLPFGSILIYKDSKNIKQLIDGLQRSTTIFEFINNPSNFFNESDVDEKIIHDVFKLTGYQKEQKNIISEQIKTSLIKWIKNKHKTMQEVLEIEADDFVYKLSKDLPYIGENIHKHREIKKVIKPIFDNYKDICRTLVNIEIPVIELKGSEEFLPEVFERINSTGATLSRFQIFSAAWSTTEIKILKKELYPIIDYVSNRYDHMVNGEIEVADFDSTELKKYKVINIFDLCFGLGKLLKSNFPYLFGSLKENVKVESIGFNLLNSILVSKVKDQKNLHILLKEFDDISLNNIITKLLHEVSYVDKLLSIVTQFKGNKRKENNITVNHTEYQIVSIISYVFISKYWKLSFDDEDNLISKEIDISQRNEVWKHREHDIRSNIIRMYIIDVINENWRGSGDKKLNNIVLNTDYYLNDVSESTFIRELDGWFNGVIDERKEYKKIRSPKEAEKVFLNATYFKLFSAEDQLNDKNFDIEHLYTKGLMKDTLAKYDGELKLPISSIGNLCYLPEKENRAKGKKTLYDDINYLKNYDLKTLEDKFTFTSREDFNCFELDLTSEEFKNEYITFLRKRYSVMKTKIIENLF